jgi:hypothetical protein
LLVVRGAASIAEGPQVEEAAQAPPHLCEPLRLEHQKDDDQQPNTMVRTGDRKTVSSEPPGSRSTMSLSSSAPWS